MYVFQASHYLNLCFSLSNGNSYETMNDREFPFIYIHNSFADLMIQIVCVLYMFISRKLGQDQSTFLTR